VFRADKSRLSAAGVPLSWHRGAKIMDRSTLAGIGDGSGEEPNESAFVVLPGSTVKSAKLFMVVCTDGGDGTFPGADHKSHRPFGVVAERAVCSGAEGFFFITVNFFFVGLLKHEK
jgi:hypothetical protein